MYNIIYETSHQSRFDARYWMLGVVHWDSPVGGYWVGGGRREEGSGWGARVYLWLIHFDIWQNQYNIVKLNKIKKKSAALDKPANLENSAVATGLEKVSFHSNLKERQFQRMLKLPHNCTHLTH